MTPRRFFRRLRDLVAWTARDRDMRDEMQFHVDSLAREFMKGGMPEAAAQLAARRQFGSPLRMKEDGHRVRGAGTFEDMLRDVRHAARRLVRAPGFTLAAVSTLALAIGANATIFTMVHRVVLSPLPYPESHRLIELDHGAALINIPAGMGMKAGLYHHYTDRARTLDGVAIFAAGDATITGDEGPQRIRVTRTTTTLASVLGVAPAAGRWFTDTDSAPGALQVAVISHGFWTRRYGRNDAVINRPASIDGVPTVIVGIMAEDYAFPDPTVDVWLPDAVNRSGGLGLWTYDGIARLREGATVADARAELDGLIRDLPQAFPGDPLLNATGAGIGVMSTARPLKEAIVGEIAGTLWLLLAAVGIVLLVAAANVANLFLVRAEARQREIAVRRALGAEGRSIARLFLTESALLSIAAGGAGLFLAWSGVRMLLAAAPANLPRLTEVHVDAAVVTFTAGLSALAALALAIVPLFGGMHLAASLHDSGRRTTASRTRHHARHLLMGAQVALALMLLVASGLLVRSFSALRAIDPGFDAASALTFSIGLPARDYPDRDAALRAHQAIRDRIADVPGVASASVSTCLPLNGPCFGNALVVEGANTPEMGQVGTVSFRAVSGGHFETMRTRMQRGRTIERRDVERREPIAVIDEVLATRFFPDEDPIGRRVSWSLPPPAPGEAPNYTWLTIVGIVDSTPVRTLGEAVRVPQIYMPMSLVGQFDARPWEYIGPQVATMNYVVRSAARTTGLLPAIRRAIDSVDPDLAIARVTTLEETLARASSGMAFTMILLSIAAAVALLLGVIGIYGVIAYVVSQRTAEIGVRLALGANPGGVSRLIVRQGGAVAAAGAAAGAAGAVAGGRFIESLLYGVSPRDPAVVATATLALLVVALLACWLPARRAAHVSPIEALRAD